MGIVGSLMNQPTFNHLFHVMFHHPIIQQLRPDVPPTLHSNASMVLPRETSLNPLPPGDEEAFSFTGSIFDFRENGWF